jgi:hypothetical protein
MLSQAIPLVITGKINQGNLNIFQLILRSFHYMYVYARAYGYP